MKLNSEHLFELATLDIIISRVLDAVKLNFPETTQFVEDCLEQECSMENTSVDEVIFLFTSLEGKYFLFSSAKL